MRLSTIKIDKLSDVSISIGQVFFASALIEPIVSGKTSISILVFGIILSVVSFGFGILLYDYFGKN